MDGGAMIGYCAIGRNGSASSPPRQMNSAITTAKIGRSMKKPAMRISSAGGTVAHGNRLRSLAVGGWSRRRSRALPGDRIHDVARFELLEAFDHDAVAGGQAF